MLIAGPCAVESYEQTRAVARMVAELGLHVLRGGAFKPRTSPHTFQGLGVEGLKILRAVADEFGLLVVTEALGVEHVPLVAEYADILQIGSRNMQHFPLLWAAAESRKPILLKRGFMATIDEWLAAAEHIRFHGNSQIILCERGIRSFDPSTRNVLDAVAIPLAHSRAPYPVIADPSHATGHAELVLPASLAAVAAGADGLIVEVHPEPSQALSDGAQSLALAEFPAYVERVRQLAQALGRKVV
uniref:3-deoxy-7-phosphoheptulonate synthase n=1 Tax=uncultured Chloroflexota bacterium TaxID=166587 RepID=H5SDX0_9CHLR|nr:3-deoxy-7-phosphoheptulonate synthase [uncultured Chloroflexota bacterium]